MYHILLFSYNKVNQRKNVFKKIITKGKHIYSIEKNPHVNGLAQFKPVCCSRVGCASGIHLPHDTQDTAFPWCYIRQCCVFR